MIVALMVAYVALLIAEAVGTGAFLVIYLRGSEWRTTAVGRHLAAYATALLGLLLLALLSIVVRSMWLAGPILLGHVAFAALVWQRVALVWRAQHRQAEE